jgi:hypothetical protein
MVYRNEKHMLLPACVVSILMKITNPFFNRGITKELDSKRDWHRQSFLLCGCAASVLRNPKPRTPNPKPRTPNPTPYTSRQTNRS